MNEGEPGQPDHSPQGEPVESAEHGAELAPELRPRIFVASLADYSAGTLHGAWIDADQAPEAIHDEIQAMLRHSPEAGRWQNLIAEEWAIHDFEDFGPLHLGEYASIDWVTTVARGVVEHGLAFAAWAAHVGSEPEQLERFEECYRGEWNSVEDYADELLEDLGAEQAIGQLDEWLQSYVDLDVEGFARDLELGGDITVVEKPEGGVWVFDAV